MSEAMSIDAASETASAANPASQAASQPTNQPTDQPAYGIDIPDWEPPPPPTDLIFDDGVPLESNRHRIAMNALIRSTLQALEGQSNFFTGGNMFVYYSRNQAMNRDFRGPDFFVALDVTGDRERQGWVVWEEDGKYPDVIVELLSASTATVDKTTKKTLYERTFKTLNYFVYDPFDPTSLQGWILDAKQRYQALAPNPQGWLWCEALQLWVGPWEGVVDREPLNGTCHWLRFYRPDGSLVPLPEEAAVQRAEQETQRAEQERLRAEQAESRLNDLMEQLRQQGIDPNQFPA